MKWGAREQESATDAVTGKVRALAAAAELSKGRSNPDVVERAQQVVDRTDKRLAFSGNHTIVALAGATGSGKSSTFNALSGTTLAEPGVRRPTTSKAMAASWGPDSPAEVLDWLEVPRRHIVSGASPELDGLVLLDLPDHDSTEVAHRLEVDRLVQLVDMFIWVVDPQKYADAALHDGYLKPLASHAEVMTVVLNQADGLTPDQLRVCLQNLRQLLDSEGLGKARVYAMSAVTGEGVAELQGRLIEAVRDKHAAAKRLSADVAQAAAALSDDLGNAQARELSEGRTRELAVALGSAAGVPVVAEAVLKATRRRGTLATGWPALSWIARFRPDPLRRLHLDVLPGKKKRPAIEPVDVQRTAMPASTTGVQKAKVDAAVRAVADEASAGLPRGWADSVRSISRANERTLGDRLDRAVATTDLGMASGFGYWKFFQALQWILITIVAAGLLWLGIDVALQYFQMPPLPNLYYFHRIPLPALMALGGAAAGVLLAVISRILVEATARTKAAGARNALNRNIAAVAQTAVIDPVNTELRRYSEAKKAVAQAR